MRAQYFSPFVWVTQYEHAAELFAVSVFSIVVPIALNCHPLTEWLWLVTAVQISVDAHTGYDFSLLDKVIPLWGGTVHHDDHHKMPKSNFQPFFTWFDYGFGTDHRTLVVANDAKAAARATKIAQNAKAE